MVSDSEPHRGRPSNRSRSRHERKQRTDSHRSKGVSISSPKLPSKAVGNIEHQSGQSDSLRRNPRQKSSSTSVSYPNHQSSTKKDREVLKDAEHSLRKPREQRRGASLSMHSQGAQSPATMPEIPRSVTHHIKKYLTSRGEAACVSNFTNSDVDFETNPDGTTAVYQRITSPYNEAIPFRCSLSRLGIP